MDPRNYRFQLTYSGQSTVEYILLVGVIVLVLMVILNSAAFKKYFDINSGVYQQLKYNIEHSYRHAYPDPKAKSFDKNPSSRYQQIHSSYYGDGDSRFFVPLKYPES